MNVVFLILVLIVLIALFSGGQAPVADSSVLVLAPKGVIVDQLTGDPLDRAVMRLQSRETPETLLGDLIHAVDSAREDSRVQVMVLDLNGFAGAGLSKLQELRKAVDRFRAAGKTVLATADIYDRNRYYLAATADEVFLHESGFFMVTGYSRYRTYYRDAIERFEVEANVFRVGEFKAAVEPYLRNTMSPEAREANLEWMGDLWRAWIQDVAEMRGLETAAVESFTEEYADRLRQTQGRMGAAALEAGLVDHVADRDAVWKRAAEILETTPEELPHLAQEDYLLAKPRLAPLPGQERVGVIVARGTILDGDHPPGTIGGDSTAELIRQARWDDSIKAIVLRVDSGGGSALASDVIRREFELAREVGKPVVVSMGSVAASGGYWISTAADEIWASPSTITGSIGIFAVFPTFEKALEKYLGTHVDGVGTTPLAGSLRFDRSLSPELGEVLQLTVEQGYREFLERVAEAREKTPEEIDRIARGRVWSGEDAHSLGLVDHLGGLDEAVASAAAMASLGEDYRVEILERDLEFGEKVLLGMMAKAQVYLPSVHLPSLGLPFDSTAAVELKKLLREQSQLLSEMNDPRRLYAHCLCGIE